MGLEIRITRDILVYLNSLPNCIAEKVKGGASSSGKADINGCYNGRSFRIEVKTPDHKNDTSEKQEHNLKKWFRAGSVVMVTYSLKSVKTAIKLLDKEKHGYKEFKEGNGCHSWVSIPPLR